MTTGERVSVVPGEYGRAAAGRLLVVVRRDSLTTS
jgi:hypothetical protein